MYFKMCLAASVLATFCFLFSCHSSQRKILVFSKTNGYRHASIEAGVAAIRQLGKNVGFGVTATEDSTYFTEEKLRDYAAVVFLNTSGDVLNNWQQADFQRFIEAGGGFVGIHGAAASEYDWKWYGRLVGAFADEKSEVKAGKVWAVASDHPSEERTSKNWYLTDEWYDFRPVPPADQVFVEKPGAGDTAKVINVSARLRWDMSPQNDFLTQPEQVILRTSEHPMAWTQAYEGGRSFYTAFGHTLSTFADATFLQHLASGIEYATGKGRLDYAKAKTQRLPPENRFVRTVLASDLNEPTELVVLPDGRVILVERRGAVKLYDPAADTLETICLLPVYAQEEEGLMGIGLDPHFTQNHWMYLYYSRNDGGRRNRLSRFVFENNQIQLSTEIMLLEVPELYGCCHTGGSIDFDSKGNLFLSTGDNSNPFESDGFNPIDERPGRALWDAQKSSANPNDLRGKILRIHPEKDGTYTIPKGNLFAEGDPGARAEIFVMGCRNPYRIAVDKATDCLYWGDVGPDAGKDGPQRGSKGYDTWNRACEAGFYGWPYFRGNHIYFDYNFATKTANGLYDPLHPVNDSPNNTGRKDLPPVKSPLIWYSYDESLEFPWLGTGGKNPMAGPVFHASPLPTSPPGGGAGTSPPPSEGPGGRPYSIFPEYFENKLFIYEWMRNWIYVVTLDSAGGYVQADPFLPSEKFVRPMDMAFAPDGSLYVLEYGTQWFAQNPDARLNRIEYAAGNRKPVAHITATPEGGGAPLKVCLSAEASEDYDGDALTCEWSLRHGTVRFEGPSFDYTFTTPGTHEVTLTVRDGQGGVSRVREKIVAGNSPPAVAWNLHGNQSFYWDTAAVQYQLTVSDLEDGRPGDPAFDARRLKLSIDYLAEGQDVAAIVLGHQTAVSSGVGSLKFMRGEGLIAKSDCKTCHALDSKVNGPSFIDIANRYYGSEFAVKSLSEKVMKGGAGNWGQTAMSAHPNLTLAEAEDIVKYILSLAGEVQAGASLPLAGVYRTTAHTGKAEQGAYVFQASYRDVGSEGVPSLTGREMLVLRYPKIEAESYSQAARGVRRQRIGQSDTTVVSGLTDGRFVVFGGLDMTEVGSVSLGFLHSEQMLPGTVAEVRSGSAYGPLLGQAALTGAETVVRLSTPVRGFHSLVLLLRNPEQREVPLGLLDWVGFERR